MLLPTQDRDLLSRQIEEMKESEIAAKRAHKNDITLVQNERDGARSQLETLRTEVCVCTGF